jgi:hypothetical protein
MKCQALNIQPRRREWYASSTSHWAGGRAAVAMRLGWERGRLGAEGAGSRLEMLTTCARAPPKMRLIGGHDVRDLETFRRQARRKHLELNQKVKRFLPPWVSALGSRLTGQAS